MKDPRDSSSPFGVMDFLAWDHDKFGRHYQKDDVEKSAALMQVAGIEFVRFDFLWEDLELAPGKFSFSKYDRLLEILLRHGLHIEAVLAYSPTWAGRNWNEAPDVVAYCRYAHAVVDHFKDRVRHWEIWHEPDNPDFWQPQDNMRAYVNLIKHVYPLLKTVDPSCIVHLGGMTRSLPMGLKNIYDEGGKGFFDVVNIHPFVNPLAPGALDAVRHMHKFIDRVLSDNGDSAIPVWFTEIGCPGMREPSSTKNWWLGSNTDESMQAKWLVDIYSHVLEWKNVEKVFWCFFRDTDNHFQSGSDYDGLVRHDFSKKPSFDAYRKLTLGTPIRDAASAPTSKPLASVTPSL